MPLSSFSPSSFRGMHHQCPHLFPIMYYSFSMDLSLILQTYLLCFVLKANKNRSRTIPFSFQSHFLKLLSAFFPTSTKRFYFSQRSWHVWWRRNLLLPNHFHTCHVMSLLSHCNIGVYTPHFNRPILWRIINHLLGVRFLWPIFKPHSIWSLHN